MAEITTQQGSQKKSTGVYVAKKLSTRVDLTPMVDLGFLLITFFIFTTSMGQPKALNMIMPDDTGNNTLIKESGALTLLPAANNTVFYYEGKWNDAGDNFHQSTINGIRQVIINKKRSTKPTDLVIILKPSNGAVYKNVVDLLDEMTINDIKKYALVDITPAEEEKINKGEN